MLSLKDVDDEAIRDGISAAIDLMDNTVRGTVAEVLVAMALDGTVTDGWGDRFGIRVLTFIELREMGLNGV